MTRIDAYFQKFAHRMIEAIDEAGYTPSAETMKAATVLYNRLKEATGPPDKGAVIQMRFSERKEAD